MGQGLVPGDIGLDLAAIQADVADLEQLHRRRDGKNLREQVFQLRQEALPVGLDAGCHQLRR
jgi:hypothetical protein